MSDGVTAKRRPSSPEEWSAYLRVYSKIYLRDVDEEDPHVTDEQLETRWMGREPATEEAVAAAERRLGVRFPPSLRGFLLTSDGWLGVGGWVDRVYGCAEIGWMRESAAGSDFPRLYRDMDNPDYAELFERVVEVASGEDFWLLDPTQPGPDGEWPAYLFEPKYGELEEFPDFAALFDESRDDLD
ncbi:SMI1/KNR4 family protein [Nocardiopsis sediminis]|uniref:SMI1/KNR4 family protein n=1 Tax=Nocardiopsis sediminis TaxID=1778267 RepID=A0ABV8FLR1_9ACTN